MRFLALASLGLFLAAGGRAAAGAPEFDAKADPKGYLQLSDGSRKRRLDLRDDVPGCIGQRYDPTTGERGAADASLIVLDTADRDGRHYVLLSAIAQPNCNVQGMCGAAAEPNVSLIWLKLKSDLTIESKQTVALVDCRTDRSVAGVKDDWDATDLKLVDGKLRLAFDEAGAAGGRVEYDRQSADQGIRVTAPR
jgi:hypothetical protein